jgi:hypothetical protein
LRWRRGSFGYFFVVMNVIAATALGQQVSAQENYSVGDEWVYDCEMVYDSMTMEGVLTVTYEGQSSKLVLGHEYLLDNLSMEGTLVLDGSIEGFQVGGSADVSSFAYYSIDTGDIVLEETNLTMSISASILGIPVTLDGWQHTIEIYTPPGGIGDDPDSEEVGTTWVKEYTIRKTEQEYMDGELEVSDNTTTETVTYSIIDRKRLTIPVGEFDCLIIQKTDSDGVQTEWRCERTGQPVKIVEEDDDGSSATMTLKSYSYTPMEETDGEIMAILPGVIVAVACAVGVAAFLLARKRRRSPEEPGSVTSQGEPPRETEEETDWGR